MNKRLIALAVAGAFAPAVALAQGTSVTIYGTLNGAWDLVEADGATRGFATFANPPVNTIGLVGSPNTVAAILGGTATQAGTSYGLNSSVNLPSRSRVDTDSSNVGFRVREDLGGGLSAWGQCELTAGFDAGGGDVCSRNSGVGVDGSFGNFFIGRWDTPYKVVTGAIDPMGNTHIISHTAVMSSLGLNTGSGTAPFSFDLRQTNVAQYWTPNWAGFSARVAYSANETKTDDVIAGTAITPGLDPYMWSASLNYDNGPINVFGAYEKHLDFVGNPLGVSATNTVVSGSDDHAWTVGGGYKFGNFRIVAQYESLTYQTDFASLTPGVPGTGNPGSTEVERDSWLIGASYSAAPHYFGLSYSDASDWDCSASAGVTAANAVNVAQAVGARCADTGAKAYAAKYEYSLSKRSSVFVHYIKIRNDRLAQYTFGTTPLTPVAPGADPQGFGVGIKHTF